MKVQFGYALFVAATRNDPEDSNPDWGKSVSFESTVLNFFAKIKVAHGDRILMLESNLKIPSGK